ncbi:ATP phosphoribosyltransferase regulatory subunit [Gloeocapsa sp. PCC 73106]|uniref:ATP phosphoribosyltransferase regulatory subunit n=1 Tax=Gloeocapsa sp. PCC 73106 TaxID=102232 RepID=UPI0002AC19E8|nr:ATP phosphoribosyltransferase regulatory subunit [Gloeocapsa sp. PCC 73106]ELR98417.1 ATP phosphoribosyltransferase, regulatory subunit [Gloeocapsa sp. PCC 73106]
MIHQPPAGARDLLPLEVAQKSWINDRLQEIFSRWGYQRIVTSTLEWVETLIAGGAIEPDSVIQLQHQREAPLGLRPELTASIARAAVTRMAGSTYPQRLCYRANIFRNPPPGYHGRQLEFYQAGVELLFAGGILADAEILLLATDCLEKIGIDQWQLILGEVGLTRSLLEVFPDPLRQQVHNCIACLDRVALERLPLNAEERKRALLIFDLRGEPEQVLAKLETVELTQAAQAIVNNLKSLTSLVAQTASIPLLLDLSLLQTIDYYTGISFKIVSNTNHQWQILGQGGRYDQLLKLYHPQSKSSPGIGFALNIEALHACLLSSSKLPQQTPPLDWLVIPLHTDAVISALLYAQKLRDSKHLVRVELDLGGRDPQTIRAYAHDCHVRYLAWVDPEGTVKIECL